MCFSKSQCGHHGHNIASPRINAYSNRAHSGAFIALLEKGWGAVKDRIYERQFIVLREFKALFMAKESDP